MAEASMREIPPDSGWVIFAGYLMIVAGFFEMIAGLVALLKPSIYLASERALLFGNYNEWGWTHLAVGFILLISAASLFAGRPWGRAVAITWATLSAIVNFGFIWAYPVWSLLIIGLDIMVIYAVVIYGGRMIDYE